MKIRTFKKAVRRAEHYKYRTPRYVYLIWGIYGPALGEISYLQYDRLEAEYNNYTHKLCYIRITRRTKDIKKLRLRSNNS